jgi:hypothetical protein
MIIEVRTLCGSRDILSWGGEALPTHSQDNFTVLRVTLRENRGRFLGLVKVLST